VQALHDEDHVLSGGAATQRTERLLETSNVVVTAHRKGVPVADLYGMRSDVRGGFYTLDGEEVTIKWERIQAPRLVWSHVSALLFLQGVPIKELRHVADPRPGMDDVVLAEICSSSVELSYEQLFHLLVPEARVA